MSKGRLIYWEWGEGFANCLPIKLLTVRLFSWETGVCCCNCRRRIRHRYDFVDRLWGYPKFDDGNFDKSVDLAWPLKMYGAFLMLYRAADRRNKEITKGWPDMIRFVKTFNFLGHVETPCSHYLFKVKKNVLQPKRTQTITDDAAV